MKNLTVLYQFRSDTATLSGGNVYPTLPLTNLQKMPLGKVVKFKGVTLADTQFLMQLNPVRSCQGFALLNHNGSQAARIKISAGTTSAASNFTTGWLNMWPYGLTDPEWEDDNWWFAQFLPEDVVGYPINFIKVFDEPLLYEYWKIEIDDTTNYNQIITATDISAATSDDSFNSVAGGFGNIGVGQTITVEGFDDPANNGDFTVVTATAYKLTVSANLVNEGAGDSVTVKTGNFTAGRVLLAPIFRPQYNQKWQPRLGYEPDSIVQKSRNGTVYARNYSNLRVYEFGWDFLSQAEAYNGVLDMQLRKGDFGDILVIPDSDDEVYKHINSIYGKMENLQGVDNPYLGIYTHAARVREVR